MIVQLFRLLYFKSKCQGYLVIWFCRIWLESHDFLVAIYKFFTQISLRFLNTWINLWIRTRCCCFYRTIVRDRGQQNNHSNKKMVHQPVCDCWIGVASDRFQELRRAFNTVATLTTTLQYQQPQESLIKRHKMFIYIYIPYSIHINTLNDIFYNTVAVIYCR